MRTEPLTHTRREFLGAAALGAAGMGRGRQPQQGAYDETSVYEPRRIEGWLVRVHRKLLEDSSGLRDRTLRLLEFQLYQIGRVMAEEPLRRLREIPIWVERFHPRHPCACYHVSVDWLRENGFNPEKAGAVEIANPENFLTWTRQQPWMVLHELAHGYHHRVLSMDEPRLKAAHEAMVKGGAYREALHINGNARPHYALTNPTEYFAESTEAYFGTNDFYPFVRSELRRHDPQMYALMEAIWGKPL